MPDPDYPPGARSAGAGLCESCIHQQIVRNTRGSVFSLCRRSREDPDYPRYPRLPVLSCPGYEPREARGRSAGPSTGGADRLG